MIALCPKLFQAFGNAEAISDNPPSFAKGDTSALISAIFIVKM